MNADEKKSLGTGKGEEKESLPPVGEPVWVQCEGYRTLACRDENGVWRTLSDGKKLKGVVKVIRG